MTGKGLIIFAREPRPGNVKTRLAAAQTAGVTALLLPVWRDIDTQQDLNSFLRRSGKLSPTGTKTSILAAAL